MRFGLYLVFMLFLTGCSGVELAQYQDNQPKLSLFSYFEGNTLGWGIVQNRSGELTRQFVVDIRGTVANDTLTLEEDFVWSDGEKSTRVWTIQKDGNHKLSGSAGDVVGTAAGEVYGNVLNWNYYLNLTIDDNTWKVYMDDWMFLQQDNVLINRTSMSKFGIHLADITITFLKQDETGGAK